MTDMLEGVLCSCGNVFLVEPVTQFVTLRFLCDGCISSIEKTLNIVYEDGEI